MRSRSVPALLSGPLAGGLISRLGRRRGEEAIRAAVVAAIHGFNAHDAKRATQAYMPESDLVTVRGDVLKGRAEIEKRPAGLFVTRLRHAAQEMLDVRIRFIAENVALAHASVEMSGLAAPAGQAVPPITSSTYACSFETRRRGGSQPFTIPSWPARRRALSSLGSHT